MRNTSCVRLCSGCRAAPSGNRLIFLNVPLLDFEQKALESLHDALKDEKAGGTR